MAGDKKLSALNELAAEPAPDDEVYIRDVSEAPAAESKRITIANLLAGAGGGAPSLFVSHFQENSATGTFSYLPAAINDNNTGSYGSANGVGQYAEVDFGRDFSIYQWRQFGMADCASDGVWKIEYYDGSWHDWVTGISTRTASWSAWTGEDVVICSKIRLTVTTLDSRWDSNPMGELEIKY